MSLSPGWYRVRGGARAHRLEKPDTYNRAMYHAACGLPLHSSVIVRDDSIDKCGECTSELIRAEEWEPGKAPPATPDALLD